MKELRVRSKTEVAKLAQSVAQAIRQSPVIPVSAVGVQACHQAERGIGASADLLGYRPWVQVHLQLAGHYVVAPTIGHPHVCNDCHRLLESKVFWVSPVPIENPTKQETEQYIWPGKSNVGRKKSEWWACCPLHPLCRHIYVRYRGANPYAYKAKPK